jgi:hypothetical protein
MQVVVTFEPPEALEKLRRWQADNAVLLSKVPPDAVRIDVGTWRRRRLRADQRR